MTQKAVLKILFATICTFGLSAYADDVAPTPLPAPVPQEPITPVPVPAEPTPPAPVIQMNDNLSKLHVLNTSEVDAGKLGIAKACNADVKEYAQLIIDEHTKNDAKLASIAQAKSLSLAATPADAKFSKKQTDQLQAMADTIVKLNAITDCTFDKEFLTAMKDGHSFAYRVAVHALNTDKDQDLSLYYALTADAIRAHYNMAKDLIKYMPAEQAPQ